MRNRPRSHLHPYNGYEALIDLAHNLLGRSRVHLVAAYRYVHPLLLSPAFPGGGTLTLDTIPNLRPVQDLMQADDARLTLE
jgi:hypothetical protein